MGVKVREKGNYVTKIPEGTLAAICIGVYDLGTVVNRKFGSEGKKMVLLFELVEERDEEGWPLTINLEVTASLGEKSTLRRLLVNWRGRAFTPDELREFDTGVLLGKPCHLLVIRNAAANGSVYANIENISQWPRGVAIPKPRHPVASFTFGEDDRLPQGVPDWIARKIEAAPEWSSQVRGTIPSGPDADGVPPVPEADLDDDRPPF